MTIEWNDGLHKLGITSIDNQHRELFSLHGDLETFDENNPPRDYLLILKRLYSYTNYHFCTEENMFGKFNFSEAPQHIKMHRAFTARVKKEFEAMKAGRPPEYRALADFVGRWIKAHIEVEDRKYAENGAFAEASRKNNQDIEARAAEIWERRKLGLNIKEIDNQHKELIFILQQVSDLNRTGISAARVSLQLPNLVRKLFYYSQFHFGLEERLMQKKAYGALGEHRKKHSFFIGRVRDFAVKAGNGDAELTDEMVHFLKEWTLSHILEDDFAFKRYLDGAVF